MALEFAGPALPLAPGDIEAEAIDRGLTPAALHMIVDVECAGSGFLHEGPPARPKILYERHLFHRLTGGRFDAAHPDISNAERGGYLGGAREYDRLGQAVLLNRDAALQSASWGLGQILGSNYRMVGFSTVQAFVAAMMAGERQQLEAILAYLDAAKLMPALTKEPPDFTAIAAGYNGRGQIAYYAAHLEAAYRKWRIHPLIPAHAANVTRTATPALFHGGAVPAGGKLSSPPSAHATPSASPRPAHAAADDPDNSASTLNQEQLDRPPGG